MESKQYPWLLHMTGNRLLHHRHPVPHQVSHKAAHILPLDGQQALLRRKLPEVCHLKDRLLVLQYMQLHLRHRHHRRVGQCELF